MARKRVIEAPALKNWEDVDGALKEIAEAQLAIGDIEAELNRQITERRPSPRGRASRTMTASRSSSAISRTS